MFLKERFSYIIVAHLGSEACNRSDVYLKKCSIFEMALNNLGAKQLQNFNNVYELSSVIYSRAIDLFEIIKIEYIRILAFDNSIPMTDKKLYEFSKEFDKIYVYLIDNNNKSFFS